MTTVGALKSTDPLRWMKIHDGLLEPKHEEKLGKRIFLFMQLINDAIWETGMVEGYSDSAMSTKRGRPKETIKRQRQELEKAGYITCKQSFQCLRIIIHKWRNPRLVSPEQINVMGIKTDPPSNNKSDPPSIESDSDHINLAPKGDTDQNDPPHDEAQDEFIAESEREDDMKESLCPHCSRNDVNGGGLMLCAECRDATTRKWSQREINEITAVIRELFEIEGTYPRMLSSQLRGTCTKTKRKMYNVTPGVTAEEIKGFVSWWEKNKGNANLPTDAIKLQSYFLTYRAELEATPPAPKVVLVAVESDVPVTDLLEPLF